MIRLTRDKRTGDYYTQDRKFQIEKGCVGWNINKWDEKLSYYKYWGSCDTLKEAREELEQENGRN